MSRKKVKQKTEREEKDINEFLTSYFFPNIVLGFIGVISILIYKLFIE